MRSGLCWVLVITVRHHSFRQVPDAVRMPSRTIMTTGLIKSGQALFEVHCAYRQPVLRLCSMMLAVSAVHQANIWNLMAAVAEHPDFQSEKSTAGHSCSAHCLKMYPACTQLPELLGIALHRGLQRAAVSI